MAFTDLLVHSADVYTRSDVNTGGRITETWIKQSTIPCRFSTPVSTRVSPVTGASFEQVDATVFTGPDLFTAVSGINPPYRFITTATGWSGTYELRTNPRIIWGDSSVHHCECDVTEVQNP